MDYLKIQQLSRDEVLNEAKDLYPRWVHLSADEKQKIVETIVDRIVVAEDEVTIELCYVPPLPKSWHKGNATSRIHCCQWPERRCPCREQSVNNLAPNTG